MKKLLISLTLSAFFVIQANAEVNYSQKIDLKFGVAVTSNHPHAVSARKFADLVLLKTGGQIEIKVFDNASLGSNPELLDGVKTGVVDFTISTPGVMAEYSNVSGILELPYIFISKDHMLEVTRGSIGEEIAAQYAKDSGIVILGYLGGAQRNIITKSKQINSIKDLKGLKMRTWEWNVMLDWWKSLGALGSVVSLPKVYTALQTGAVDGAENEFSSFTTARWAGVAKNIALTQHSITVRPLIMSEKKLNSLPYFLRSAIKQAGLETADFDVQLEAEHDASNLAKLKKDYGIKVTFPDKQPFIDASSKIIKNYAKDKGLKDLANKIKKAVDKI